MFVVIEVHRHGNEDPPIPAIKGKYDVYVVPFSGLGQTLQDFAEDFSEAQGVRLTLTLQDWSKEQADAFLETVQ